MNKNQVQGSLRDIAGKIQEQAGKLTGNKRQEIKGIVNQALGEFQQTQDDATLNIHQPKTNSPKSSSSP